MENYDLFQSRLRSENKISEDKLIQDKVKTFKRALESSYNRELVQVNGIEFSALISYLPTDINKIDHKSFSTLLDNNCCVGTSIYWVRDNSRWIITEQSQTEKAIFQGYIDKANYELTWLNPTTGKQYKQWACAKGPSDRTIEDGVKDSIIYDQFSDSLYLIISKNTLGIELFERYFEIMVNGKKWIIQVVDNITNPNLLTIYLKETSFDRDTDTSEVVDGKIEHSFIFTSSLDNITELILNKQIDLNPVLYRDGIIQDTLYTIKTTNCIHNNGEITFNNLGSAIVSITYGSIGKTYKYTINIVQESSSTTELSFIVGDSIVKTLNSTIFTFINLVNGTNIPLAGDWTVDSQYFTILNKNSHNMTVKSTTKTGITSIKYIIGTEEYVKEIKIVPMFGGN